VSDNLINALLVLLGTAPWAVAYFMANQRANEARALNTELVAALEGVEKAWSYEANQGDGIMDEHGPAMIAARVALAKARVRGGK
jgi:hypothetical protein